jgi:hypothetical protein
MLGYGFLVWLIPFLVAFLAFPLRERARPVFESVMAVTVAATAVVLGLRYLRATGGSGWRDGLMAGIVWLLACIAIDTPLMLFGGPMQMTLVEYLGDIGLTYLTIPIVTTGLAAKQVDR